MLSLADVIDALAEFHSPGKRALDRQQILAPVMPLMQTKQKYFAFY